MNLESPKVSIKKSPEEVFDYLSNIKNFEALMPENISKFEVLDENKFLFALKGMPEIVLKKKEVVPPNKIILGAAGGKIDFSLIANIIKIDDNSSDVTFDFEGDLNPMMAMMVKNPLNKFLQTLASNIPEAF